MLMGHPVYRHITILNRNNHPFVSSIRVPLTSTRRKQQRKFLNGPFLSTTLFAHSSCSFTWHKPCAYITTNGDRTKAPALSTTTYPEPKTFSRSFSTSYIQSPLSCALVYTSKERSGVDNFLPCAHGKILILENVSIAAFRSEISVSTFFCTNH